MSYSPAPMPPWSGESDSPSASGSHHARTEADQDFSRHESVLEALREQVVSGEDIEGLLDAITVAAQIITEANGAALGMRREGAVVCVGRSGETAPALGVRLSEESGISGECLRMGRTLRCGDSETDPRVDAEVCRALNIRSIAAVPVRSNDSTVGVLEVFSMSARAFTDEHVAFLSSLAGLVEIACSNVEFRRSPLVHDVPAFGELPRADVAGPPVSSVFWAETPWWQQSKWRYGMAAAVALVALLSVAGWYLLRASSREVAAQPVQTQPAVTTISEDLAAPTISETLNKPGPGGTNSAAGSKKPPLVQASEKEIDEPLVRRFNTEPPQPASGASPATMRSSAGPESVNEPPQIPVQSARNEALGSVIASTTPMPTLGIPVSQGVTPLVLERRVVPKYPAQALAMKVEGTVELRASVNERGRVDQVSLVSGSPALGKAAMEAVKEWRYRPAQLNGKPVRTETLITINFQAYAAR